MTQSPIALGAILYPGFEMLDLYGPLELFSMIPPDQLSIHTVAEQPGPVASAKGMASAGIAAILFAATRRVLLASRVPNLLVAAVRFAFSAA